MNPRDFIAGLGSAAAQGGDTAAGSTELGARVPAG